jgi:anti-anti-sigma regulatory factor
MTSPLVLPARAGLPEAEAFLAGLRDAGAVPVIDARGVEDISSAWVLALAALVRAQGEAQRIAVIAPSPAFVDAFSDLGLFQDLMKMEFRQ